MLNAVEFTTTESEFLIRLDRSSVNAAILEQITEYVHQLVKPLPPQNRDGTAPSIHELRQMPKLEREAILRAQAAQLADDENIDDDQDLMEDDE
jgi:hypothetical protein